LIVRLPLPGRNRRPTDAFPEVVVPSLAASRKRLFAVTRKSTGELPGPSSATKVTRTTYVAFGLRGFETLRLETARRGGESSKSATPFHASIVAPAES
jgi:hypothetical protein